MKCVILNLLFLMRKIIYCRELILGKIHVTCVIKHNLSVVFLISILLYKIITSVKFI